MVVMTSDLSTFDIKYRSTMTIEAKALSNFLTNCMFKDKGVEAEV